MKPNANPITTGMKQGFWFASATLAVWAVTAFASAAWGALPTVNTWSGLTSTAWNDLVGHVNTLASAVIVSSGNVGLGIAPTAKLDVNGDALVRWGITASNFWTAYSSTFPNDMAFVGGGSIASSTTAAMPVGTYAYQLYGCAGQNSFSAGAVWVIEFVTGWGNSIGTNYFDNTNVGAGSCGYFRSGYIKVTTPGSTVRMRIGPGYPGSSNTDINPSANSFTVTIWQIL